MFLKNSREEFIGLYYLFGRISCNELDEFLGGLEMWRVVSVFLSDTLVMHGLNPGNVNFKAQGSQAKQAKICTKIIIIMF